MQAMTSFYSSFAATNAKRKYGTISGEISFVFSCCAPKIATMMEYINILFIRIIVIVHNIHDYYYHHRRKVSVDQNNKQKIRAQNRRRKNLFITKFAHRHASIYAITCSYAVASQFDGIKMQSNMHKFAQKTYSIHVLC